MTFSENDPLADTAFHGGAVGRKKKKKEKRNLNLDL